MKARMDKWRAGRPVVQRRDDAGRRHGSD